MNNILVFSIVLAIVAAIIDNTIGLKEPWRKIIYIGVLILFVVGIILFLVPGLLAPLR